MTSVLIVDDSRSVRTSLTRLVSWSSGEGLGLAGAFATGGEAMAYVAAGGAFDVALVDLGLPDVPGTRVLSELRRLRPGACLVAFTVEDDPVAILAAIRAGARGYLLKGTPPDRLLAAIREAAVGGAPLTPRIARTVLDALGTVAPAAPLEDLTPREAEVLERLARGETYAEVARRLGIGLGTVQSHVKSIYKKLEVGSKTEAAAVALSRGLVRV